VTGAAGGEAEGVDDHVALVWGDGHQLVVHVLLLTHSRVSGQEKRLKILQLKLITVTSPSKAPHLTLVALSVTHSDLHQLGQLCSVVRLVDNIHHHTFLVPGLSGCDVPGAAPTH